MTPAEKNLREHRTRADADGVLITLSNEALDETLAEIERLRNRQEDRLDDNHWNTLQEILNALSDLPGVFERVEAFMIGRGIESPKVEIEALHKIAF